MLRKSKVVSTTASLSDSSHRNGVVHSEPHSKLNSWQQQDKFAVQLCLSPLSSPATAQPTTARKTRETTNQDHAHTHRRDCVISLAVRSNFISAATPTRISWNRDPFTLAKASSMRSPRPTFFGSLSASFVASAGADHGRSSANSLLCVFWKRCAAFL